MDSATAVLERFARSKDMVEEGKGFRGLSALLLLDIRLSCLKVLCGKITLTTLEEKPGEQTWTPNLRQAKGIPSELEKTASLKEDISVNSRT